MLNLGYAAADITPIQPGITLSGFAARLDQPSTGIDAPLAVHAVYLAGEADALLLLVFDLLGLCGELADAIAADLAPIAAGAPRPAQVQLACTHTHSAPACQDLIGCGKPVPEYWQLVRRRAVEAARQAIAAPVPVRLAVDTVELPGIARNRRYVHDDGRVAMAPAAGRSVTHHGPTFDRAALLRFVAVDGSPVLNLVHWACHPVCFSGQRVTADFPGELRRQLAGHLGAPCVYLQGASGNLNPPVMGGPPEQMQAMASQVAGSVAEAATALPGEAGMSVLTDRIFLPYAPVLPRPRLADCAAKLAHLAATGQCPETTADLADIIGGRDGELRDTPMLRHIAAAMATWAETTLDRNPMPAGETLPVRTCRLGPVTLCFAGVEPFIETAMALQQACPDRLVLLAGYAGQVVGYLPTDQAIDQGGYEAASAYRWYSRPAPFAKGTEPLLVSCLLNLIQR